MKVQKNNLGWLKNHWDFVQKLLNNIYFCSQFLNFPQCRWLVVSKAIEFDCKTADQQTLSSRSVYVCTILSALKAKWFLRGLHSLSLLGWLLLLLPSYPFINRFARRPLFQTYKKKMERTKREKEKRWSEVREESSSNLFP